MLSKHISHRIRASRIIYKGRGTYDFISRDSFEIRMLADVSVRAAPETARGLAARGRPERSAKSSRRCGGAGAAQCADAQVQLARARDGVAAGDAVPPLVRALPPAFSHAVRAGLHPRGPRLRALVRRGADRTPPGSAPSADVACGLVLRRCTGMYELGRCGGGRSLYAVLRSKHSNQLIQYMYSLSLCFQ